MNPERAQLEAGIRRGLVFGAAVFAIAVSFGVLARPVMGSVAAIVMSIIVFSGAAQFGALAVLAAGGAPAPRSRPGCSSMPGTWPWDSGSRPRYGAG